MMTFMLAKESLDVIYINIWAIVISLVNLLILFLLLKKFLFKPVTRIMAERRAKVDAIVSDAEAARAAAEADKAAYAERMAAADADAAEVIRRATATATRESEVIVATARERAAAVKKQAEGDISLIQNKGGKELITGRSGFSMKHYKKVVERELTPADHHAMIDAFIAGMDSGDSHA